MKYDKGSFITVPSREVLRGIDPTAQALYMWLCSYANETGNCFPSRSTLAGDVGVSPRTIDIMLETLVQAGLVKKQERYKDRQRLSNMYTVLVVQVDAGIAIPIAESALGVASNLRTELNPVLTKNSATRVPVEEVPVYEEDLRIRKPVKYPNAREVFKWFPSPQPSWTIDTTQLKHAELLHERGETAVRGILKFVAKHQDDEYFPKVVKPSDLERKWEDIKAFKV